MNSFTESNITLKFPDDKYFRFSECAAYRRLSSNHFKEMDACWYESASNTYWLIELKDYSLATIASSASIDARVWDMIKKAVDSFCMFLSVKHNYPYGLYFDPNLPYHPDPNTQFKFISIIHCSPSQQPDVQLMHDKFKARFKSYAELFGIRYYAIVEHESAKRIIPNGLVH